MALADLSIPSPNTAARKPGIAGARRAAGWPGRGHGGVSVAR